MNYLETINRVLHNWYIHFAELTPRLIVGLLVFFFFLTTSTFLSRFAVKLLHRFFPQTKTGSVVILISFFRFLIILMGTFVALEVMGFSGFLVKFLGSLGVAGVIAGVALKDLVSSIFSGMLVGIDKAFKVGDYIMIGNNSGVVQSIGFLTTKLLTDDGKKVYIPNQVIFNAPFFNITDSPQRRVILDFEIPVGEDLNKAREVILDELKHINHIDKTDKGEVIFTNITQGFFTMQVKFLIKVGANFTNAKSDAIMKVNDRLLKEKVNLVTPTTINVSTNS